MPCAVDRIPNGARRFLGDVRAKTIGSRFDAVDMETVSISGVFSSRSPWSIDLLQEAGDPTAVRGEGSGVRSISGPTPGEDKAEAGDREPALWRAAARVVRTLELRTGSPIAIEDSRDSVWLYTAIGIVSDESSRSFSTTELVLTRRPALSGVWLRGDTIVGCACEGVVSRAWSDASYWNSGCKTLEGIAEACLLLKWLGSESVSLEA